MGSGTYRLDKGSRPAVRVTRPSSPTSGRLHTSQMSGAPIPSSPSWGATTLGATKQTAATSTHASNPPPIAVRRDTVSGVPTKPDSHSRAQHHPDQHGASQHAQAHSDQQHE